MRTMSFGLAQGTRRRSKRALEDDVHLSLLDANRIDRVYW